MKVRLLICLIVVSVATLAIMLSGVLGFLIANTWLSASAREYADRCNVAIARTWSQADLIQFLAPGLEEKVAREKLDNLFDNFRKLGDLKNYSESEGDSQMIWTSDKGFQIKAFTQAKAEFENGDAIIQTSLVWVNGSWHVSHFRVESSPLINYN